MQFGKVDNPNEINFSLPPDHTDTRKLLAKYKTNDDFQVYVGCAKWNKTDLKGFYPRGTNDELTYYSRQFNSIELNATFYRMPSVQQILSWKSKTPSGFKFFPKITNEITHFKRLINVEKSLNEFCNAVCNFEEQLGAVFMQLHDNFSPENYQRLKDALKLFPKDISLAVEVRNHRWFADPQLFRRYCDLLQQFNCINIIVDTAGRRDLLHMRLTSPVAFIRYVGANHSSDTMRLDDWINRIKKWREQGLQKLYFFVHQNIEKESPLLAAYFINRINKELGLTLTVPQMADNASPMNQAGLF